MTHLLLVIATWYLSIGLGLWICFLLMHFSMGGKFRELIDAAIKERHGVPVPSAASVAIGLMLGVLLKWPLIVINTVRQVWLKYSQPRS